MKKSLLFVFVFLGTFIYVTAQTNSENNVIPSQDVRSKKVEVEENNTNNNSGAYSSDPIIEGSHLIITVDRYGNRTETIVPAVTVSQRRIELNTQVESLQAKLYSAQNESPVDPNRIQEIELLISETEQELNALPQ